MYKEIILYFLRLNNAPFLTKEIKQPRPVYIAETVKMTKMIIILFTVAAPRAVTFFIPAVGAKLLLGKPDGLDHVVETVVS